MIDQSTADDIRRRERQLRVWLGKRTSYHPSELPAGLNPPTNEERGQLELFEFTSCPPSRYFLYISEQEKEARTWNGVKLGSVSFGASFRDNMGGVRVPITVRGVNGWHYHGTYYKSAGDYARIRAYKRQGVANG